jgi:hypothetical protein
MQKFHLQIGHGRFLLRTHYHIQSSFDAKWSAQLRVLLLLPPCWSNALGTEYFTQITHQQITCRSLKQQRRARWNQRQTENISTWVIFVIDMIHRKQFLIRNKRPFTNSRLVTQVTLMPCWTFFCYNNPKFRKIGAIVQCYKPFIYRVRDKDVTRFRARHTEAPTNYLCLSRY